MTRLLDLDEVVPQDIPVRLRGRDFTIPGDPPMEIYVQLLDLQERSENIADDAGTDEQRELLDGVFDPVYRLFAFCDPELDRQEFLGLIGVRQASAVLAQVMSAYADRGVEPPERPTTGPRRSSRPGAPSRKRTKSASSMSSRT